MMVKINKYILHLYLKILMFENVLWYSIHYLFLVISEYNVTLQYFTVHAFYNLKDM